MKSNIILIIIAVVVALVVVIVGWSLYYMNQLQTGNSYDQSTIQTRQQEQQIDDNTAQEISNDLNQIPDDSSVNREIDSLNADVQSF